MEGAVAMNSRILRSQSFSTLQSATQFDLRAQDGKQTLVFPGLLDEIPGPAPHRLDRKIHVTPRCHQDNGQSVVQGNYLG
jgi:hypothetical protein